MIQTTGRTSMRNRVLAVLIAAAIGLSSLILTASSAEARWDPYRNIRERVVALERDGRHADVTVRVKSLRKRTRDVVCVTVVFSSTHARDSVTFHRLVPGEPQRFTTRIRNGFSQGWPRHVKSTCFVES